MTNKERYKQAFSTLHSSGQFTLEVEEMKQIQKKHRKNMAVAAAVACAVVIGAGGTAYAADIGGIQQKISIWIRGEQTEVHVTENGENGSGGYTFTYSQEGGTKEISGGGVSLDDSGRVWVYYYDQKVEITDAFDESGACSLTLTHDDETVYLEITKHEDGRYSYEQTSIPGDGSAQTEVVEDSDTDTTATTFYGITDGR